MFLCFSMCLSSWWILISVGDLGGVNHNTIAWQHQNSQHLSHNVLFTWLLFSWFSSSLSTILMIMKTQILTIHHLLLQWSCTQEKTKQNMVLLLMKFQAAQILYQTGNHIIKTATACFLLSSPFPFCFRLVYIARHNFTTIYR